MAAWGKRGEAAAPTRQDLGAPPVAGRLSGRHSRQIVRCCVDRCALARLHTGRRCGAHGGPLVPLGWGHRTPGLLAPAAVAADTAAAAAAVVAVAPVSDVGVPES